MLSFTKNTSWPKLMKRVGLTQVAPPSVVFNTKDVKDPPAAQPVVLLTKWTALISPETPLDCVVHVLPPSLV